MIRVHLLGQIGLVASDGSELTAVLQQPKRFGLLAYLAASRPKRLHRRDSLLALFWPESDDVHARAALRRALHFLRKWLGEEAIVARGDEVGTNPDRLWCDAGAAQDALAEGRDEEAVAHYCGGLLEGFFVASAPEFQRWVDEEGARLRRSVADAAARLAEQAETHDRSPDAVAWLRRAMELAPDDEAVCQRLVRRLDQTGDRAAAIQAYEAFARRMTDELGLTPSPETRALVQTIRDRRDIHPQREPRAPAGEDTIHTESPDLIAVLPFVVRGDEEFAYLQEGLVDLLCAKLDGAGDLRTVDAHAMLTHVLPRESPIDGDTARQTAVHFGAGAYVVGSVVADRGRLQVRVTLCEMAGKKELQVDAEGNAEQGIFAVVDTLVRKILSGRSTSIGGHLGRLAAVTTGSLPALKAYLRAERAFRAGEYARALEALEAAVAEDDKFALAWYRLAAVRLARGALDEARAAAASAWRVRQRLAEHTRLLLDAQRAWLDGSIERAERLFTRVLEDRPEDVEAWYHLGYIRFASNFYRGRLVGEARGALERAVELDPKHVAALGTLARIAAAERRTDDVETLVSRYLTLSPAGDLELPLRALRALATRDTKEAHDVVAQLASAAPPVVAAAASNMALAGDLAHAGAALERLTRSAATDAARLSAALVGAHVAFARRNLHEALNHLAVAALVDPLLALEHRAWLYSLLATDVSADLVEQTRTDLAASSIGDRDRTPEGSPVLHDGLHAHLQNYLDALLAIKQGDVETARSRAERCTELSEPASFANMAENMARGVRARLAFAENDAERVLAELTDIELGPWIHLGERSPVFALGAERALRGNALEVLGRTAEAAGWLGSLAERSPFDLVLRHYDGEGGVG